MDFTPEQVSKLNEASLTLPLLDWLVTSRLLLENVAVASAFRDELPEILRATPLEYLALVRDEIKALDEMLADAEAHNCATGNSGILDPLLSHYAAIKTAAKERLALQLAGVDPDAE